MPANAIDGSLATYWQPKAGGTTKTLNIDLGAGRDVETIRLQWYSVNHRFVDYTVTVGNGVDPDVIEVVTDETAADQLVTLDTLVEDATDISIVATEWTNNSSLNYGPALKDVELSPVPPPAVGPSSPDASYGTNTPAKAFDVNNATYWQPQGGTTTTTKTLVYGFDAPRSLSHVAVDFYSTGTRFIDFTVETSTDGTTWATQKTVVGHATAAYSDGFASVSDVEFVRLVATKWTSGNPAKYGPAVREVRFTAPAAVVPPVGPSSPDASYGTNTPAKAFDVNNATYWQPQGGTTTTTKTLVYGFDAERALSHVAVDFYSTGTRFIDFTVETSSDGVAWATQDEVVGNTSAAHSGGFDEVLGVEFVRLVATKWTSGNPAKYGPAVREVRFTAPTPVVPPVGGSSPDASYGTNTPAKAFDGESATYWQPNSSAAGEDKTLVYGFADARELSHVEIDFYSSGSRFVDFTVQTSADGSTWATQQTVTGHGTAAYSDGFAPVSGVKWVRLVATDWVSSNPARYGPAVREVRFTAPAAVLPPVGGSSPDASYESNTPAKAFDGESATFWQPQSSAAGEDKTLVYGFADARELSHVEIDFYSAGTRFVDFTVETSTDGAAWAIQETVVGHGTAAYSDGFAPVSGVKWVRLVATDWVSNNPAEYGPAVREVRFAATVPDEGASSPDLTYGSNTPAKAFDDSASSYWQPVGGLTTSSKTLVFGYATEQSITGVTTNFLSATNRFIDYTVQTSADGTTWTTQATVTDNAVASVPTTFSATGVKYVRLVATEWTSSNTSKYGPAVTDVDITVVT